MGNWAISIRPLSGQPAIRTAPSSGPARFGKRIRPFRNSQNKWTPRLLVWNRTAYPHPVPLGGVLDRETNTFEENCRDGHRRHNRALTKSVEAQPSLVDYWGSRHKWHISLPMLTHIDERRDRGFSKNWNSEKIGPSKTRP